MPKREAHIEILQRMAQLFRAERETEGITQIELAQRLRITQGNLSKIEGGESAPNVIVWLEFCACFKLPENIAMNPKLFKQKMAELSRRQSVKSKILNEKA